MMILPLAIGAMAVLITLCYASYLDIIDRRVPFVTWIPMLAVGIPMVLFALVSAYTDPLVISGYIGTVSVILFLAFLLNRHEKEEFSLSEALLGISVLLVNGAVAFMFMSYGFVLPGALQISVTVLLCYVLIREIGCWDSGISLWWPVIYFFITMMIWFPYAYTYTSLYSVCLTLIPLFCLLFYFFMAKSLFGGADGWALIFITLLIPLFPWEPVFGYPRLQFFPFTVLVNAVIFNLAAPAGLFFVNIFRGNRAPLRYLFLGYPVDEERLPGSFGFVMEEMGIEDGMLKRRFIGVRESLGSMVRGKKRVYTKDLRLHPEQYTEETALYKKAGTVWISYGIPFIVPITAGMIFGLCIGDILVICLKAAGGL